MAKKKKPAPPPDDGPPGVPEWVVTYGDMMSLLLTFFIMLVSMSEQRSDSGEARAAMDAIRESFGPQSGRFGVPGRSPNRKGSSGKMASAGERSEGGVKKASHDGAGRGGANDPVQRISEGAHITLGGPIIFGQFQAELTPELQKNLDILADILRKKQMMLMVRGHATPEQTPPTSPYKDPIELSYARAKNVYDYLLTKGLTPQQMHLHAVGSAEPRVLTRDEEKLSMNRRVDVFLMDSYKKQEQE